MMWPKNHSRLGADGLRQLLLFFILMSYFTSGYAAVPTAAEMLQNIADQLPNIMKLVTAIAYVMGMFFIINGILKLKQYGEQRTMMSGEHHLSRPIIALVIGTALLYLPSAVQVGMSTFWANPNPYGYLDNQDPWLQTINSALIVFQLFGVISFIRGLVIISHLAGHGGNQPGTLAKGLVHIVAGIFCINIYQFTQMVAATLGISFW